MTRWQRRSWWGIALGMVMMLSMGTAFVRQAEAQIPGDGVVRIQQLYYPESLDPQLGAGTFFSAILGANYEGLTRLDDHLDVVPAAADSWEFDASGTILTFHLRDDLTYSDGSPLTASRFVDAVLRACDPHLPGDYQHILFDIAGCEEFATLMLEAPGTPTPDDAAYQAARAAVGVCELDPRTLEIRLDHPAPYFPAIASLPIVFPAKQELIAQGGEGWWRDPAALVGNGPFQITRLEPDQLVVFAPNERYWAGPPAADGLEYVYVADGSVALEAYQVGDLDMIFLDEAHLPMAEEDPALSQQLVRIAGASSAMLSFNLTQEPFTDPKVREAFAYGFDREAYCQVLQDDGCIPALNWIPPDLPGHVATTAYAFDPEAARRALAESSYGGPDQLPEIAYVYWVEYPREADIAEWVAGQYRDILGVEITLQPMEGQAMVEAMSHVATYPQMVMSGWVQDYPDPQNWLSVFWTCNSTFAREFGYCNPRFDEVARQADHELDPALRLALYEEAGLMLIDDVPGVFVSHGVFHFLVKPEIGGIVTTPVDSTWPGQTASLLTLEKQ